ncbi:MAG: phenylalanine--tRNA ligase subunit alpha [Planctomycetaceae bacterium]
MDAITAFDECETSALQAFQQASSVSELESVRVQFLGKKNGRLHALQSLLGQAEPQERPALGKRFNEVKQRISVAWDARRTELEVPQQVQDALDVTVPGTRWELGRCHPLTQTIHEFKDLMGRFGFTVVDGPEIEDEHHNFAALNIPPHHPACDPLDNFYLATAQTASGNKLLRSQTSTVQIRVMEQTNQPVRIVSVGRVYRPDTIDATHSCMFHQMEGLLVGPDVNMAQLKATLRMFAEAYLGQEVQVRFRPSFFPFTEPSAEVDMLWGQDWLEIGGAGMVDPNVLSAVGFDPELFSGFAFGLGVERFCMRRHEITDIRRFYENDVRFLRQF